MIWRRVQRQSPRLLLVLQDLFGSSVFGFVQADIKSNINVRIAFVDHGVICLPFWVRASVGGMKQIQMILARWKLWSNTKLGTQ